MTRVAVVLSCALLAASVVDAQASLVPFARTQAERDALTHLGDGLLVSARTDGERVLREDRDSLVGHYVVGRSLYEADGSLARAMYHLGRAREIYETRWPVRMPPSSAPRELHQELLFTLARLAGEMELAEYQLELLGFYDHLYDPDLVAERCWPLMKLGRLDEAREFAEVAVGSPSFFQRSAGLNALCALEGEARNREAYAEACEAALESARTELRQADDPGEVSITVDAYNAALAALAGLRFDEAERFAQEGAARMEASVANPWMLLAELHFSQGRDEAALRAVRASLAWSDRLPASVREQARAEMEALLAIAFWLAGDDERALMRIDRALARPDRRGLTTDSAAMARGRHALLRTLIRRSLAEQRAEEASWTGFGSRMWHGLGAPLRWAESWPDRSRVTAVLSDDARLEDTVRPYLPGGVDGLSPWLTPSLVDVLGGAVVATALERATRRDAESEEARAYGRALRVELAAARGDADGAVEQARALIAHFGERERRLVAGAAARAAAAAASRGRSRDANELFQVAMERDPHVIRRLGLALPTAIRASGSGDAAEAAAWLRVSPRFRAADGAFVLEIQPAGPEALRACLRTALGNELRCAEARMPPEEPPRAEPDGEDDDSDAEEPPDPDADLTLAQRLAREVHAEMFSARIEMGRVDLSSLDGSSRGGSRRANERLQELVGDRAE